MFNSLIEKKNNYKPLLKFFSDNMGITKRNVSVFEFDEIYQGIKNVGVVRKV